MNGVLNIIKPPHMTSHDVVAIARRSLGIKKIGHTGTLDPMAAGVLPICIGRATKIVELIQDDRKVYRCEMTLGMTTDTQDKWGEPTEEKPWEHVNEEDVRKAVLSFIGDIEQIPPMYSALKVDGRKLYELAREGHTIERKARIRTIYGIDVLRMEDNRVWMDVECAKGTYIRTLCHDIGQVLGCGAHMSFLLRTATGVFNLENGIDIETLQAFKEEPENIEHHLISVEASLRALKQIETPGSLEQKLMNGVRLNLAEYAKGIDPEIDQLFRVYAADVFIGIGKCRSLDPVEIRMEKLFNL